MIEANHPYLRESFVPRNYEVTVDDIEIYGPQAIFALTGAEKWIEEHRLPKVGMLDIEATAALVDIPVVYTDIPGHGQINGLPGTKHEDEPLEIRISPYDSLAEQKMTFGHEVGHAFLTLVLNTNPGQSSREIEDFCELFGLNYVVPSEYFEYPTDVDEQTLLEIHEVFGVKMNDIIYEFVRRGKLPGRMYVDSMIGFGKREGQVVRDVICQPCREDFGSCEGLMTPDRILDFSDYTFGGNFSVCKSDDGSGKPRKPLKPLTNIPVLDHLYEEPF